MMTNSLAKYWVDGVCGSTPRIRTPGEYRPVMEEAKSAPRRNHLWSVWSVIVGAPLFITRHAVKLVPGSLRAALTARAEERILARNIKRLEGLAPHLLDDIGIEEVESGVYVIMTTDEPFADAHRPQPDVSAFQKEPATRAARPALRRMRVPLAERALVAPLGAVSLLARALPNDQPSLYGPGSSLPRSATPHQQSGRDQ